MNVSRRTELGCAGAGARFSGRAAMNPGPRANAGPIHRRALRLDLRLDERRKSIRRVGVSARNRKGGSVDSGRSTRMGRLPAIGIRASGDKLFPPPARFAARRDVDAAVTQLGVGRRAAEARARLIEKGVWLRSVSSKHAVIRQL